MSGTALMVTEQGYAGLVSTATMDGIVSAILWARHIDNLKTVLFAAEGQTGGVFQAPALTSQKNLRRLYCVSLPLVDDDIGPVTQVISRGNLTDITWLDHHNMHADHVSALNVHGAKVINDVSFYDSHTLLWSHLKVQDEVGEALAVAMGQGLTAASEPWASWLFVILAVREEPYDIRHAIEPLVEGRTLAYDPALREAGIAHWEEILALAETPVYQVDAGNKRLATLGLAATHRLDYRLITDRLMQKRDVDICLFFFDDLNRLVIRFKPTEGQGADPLHVLGERLSEKDFHVYHYDRHTLFLEHRSSTNTQQMMEYAIEAVTSAFS